MQLQLEACSQTATSKMLHLKVVLIHLAMALPYGDSSTRVQDTSILSVNVLALTYSGSLDDQCTSLGTKTLAPKKNFSSFLFFSCISIKIH